MGIHLAKKIKKEAIPWNTHNLVSRCAGDDVGSFLQIGLQQPDERRDVSCAFPQHGLQEVRKQGHVGGGDGAAVDLQQQRHNLEDVRHKLCRARDEMRGWVNKNMASGLCTIKRLYTNTLYALLFWCLGSVRLLLFFRKLRWHSSHTLYSSDSIYNV